MKNKNKLKNKRLLMNKKIIDEQQAIDEQNKPYSPVSVKNYSVEDLKKLLNENKIKFSSKANKIDLYNILLPYQLV